MGGKLFSGVSQAYECTNCGRDYAALLPTSVIPMAAVALSAGQFWGKVLSHFCASLVLAYTSGLLISLLSIIGGLIALSHISNRWLKTKQCEQCGQTLKGVGSGFVSDTLPTRNELVVYVLSVSIPLVSWYMLAR